MPQVEIFVDIFGSDGIPHTFIKAYDSDGNATEYGFGPATPMKLIDDGKVFINENHEFNSSSGKMAITNEQYQNLIEAINKSIIKLPDYNLFTGKTCTRWALNMLNEADIIPGLLANNTWFTTIFDTLIFNPYLQHIGFKINDLLSTSYNAAQQFLRTVFADPLVLDMDGDGIETVAANAGNPVYFDFSGDGTSTSAGWISPDDAYLVFDRNHNGIIDDASELFSDYTPLYAGGRAANGFVALVQEDTNADGVINSLDANWNKLRIWRDLNRPLKSIHMLRCAAVLGVATYPESTPHFSGFARLASERI